MASGGGGCSVGALGSGAVVSGDDVSGDAGVSIGGDDTALGSVKARGSDGSSTCNEGVGEVALVSLATATSCEG